MSNNESSSPETKPSDASPPAEVTTPEAEAPSSASFGGWFSSIVQSAKETVNKSAGTLENIKRDFSEFKESVQNDATSMMYSTASIVKNKLEEIGNTVNEISSLGADEEDETESIEGLESKKQHNEEKEAKTTSKKSEVTGEEEDDEGEQNPFNLETINVWTNILTDRAKSTISKVKETLVDSIFINREFLVDELNEEPYVIKNGQIVPIANWKEMLYSLQVNPDTYCREPSGPPEEFDLWLTKFNLMNYQKQMEYLLDNVPEILKLHCNLVPTELSDSDFWHRYYFKVHQLKEEQTRLILQSNDQANVASADEASRTKSNSVNVKYLSEKSSASEGSQGDADSKISRSSTEDWEKMADAEGVRGTSKTLETDKSSSDEDRDWVKCD